MSPETNALLCALRLAGLDVIVRFSFDEDSQFEECNGESYYGNPDIHVYLRCDVRDRETDNVLASLCGIDIMKDDPAWTRQLQRYNPDLEPSEAASLPSYLGEISRELLEECATCL